MSKRLLKDLKAVQEDQEWKFTAEPENGDLSKIICSFPGPASSPYEGGVFKVQMDVPIEYPLKSPRAKFLTKVYHPNISSESGAICLDILQKTWSPKYNVLSILVSLQQLLDSPNPDDPQDAQVANVYLNDKPKFEATAQQWTQKYAQGEFDEQSVAEFTQMGFDKSKVLSVFKELNLTKIKTPEDREAVVQKLL